MSQPDFDGPFVTLPGVLDRSARGKLRFTGEQARWFCDQLLSNQLVHLPEGSGAEALLLTPHGRITALVRVLHSQGELLADTEPGLAAGILSFLEGRIFATRVQIADVTATVGLISVLGPGADAVVAGALGAAATDLPGGEEYASTAVGPVTLVRVLRPGIGVDLLLPASDVPATIKALQAAGGAAATEEAYESARVRGGVARDRRDVDETFLPQEAALERAVHFAKGCYLGQEAVAMTQRGRVKRRLRHLLFDGAPALGSVWYGGAEVGRVTSITTDAGPAFGIGVVKTAVALGEQVQVGPAPEGGMTAVVAELPGSVSGPDLPSARELRERLAAGQPTAR